jgi:hypothetical protein
VDVAIYETLVKEPNVHGQQGMTGAKVASDAARTVPASVRERK